VLSINPAEHCRPLSLRTVNKLKFYKRQIISSYAQKLAVLLTNTIGRIASRN